MSDDTGIVRRTRSRGSVAGLALMLVLAGCTRSSDPSGTPDAGDGEQASVVQPTETGPSGNTADQASDDFDPGPDLYRVDPATGETEPILSAAEVLHEPERSPNGSQLVYQSLGPRGIPQIFVLDHGRSRQLTRLPGGALEPTWSPDGTRIAFAGAVRVGRNPDIFVMDADGSHVRVLARTHRQERRPDWSPDGSRVVFDTYGAVWVVSVHDGELTRLPSVSFITHRHGLVADATWSPDGRWIAFTRFDPGTLNAMLPYAHLWVVRSDGTDERQLNPPWTHGGYELDPSWSPDGTSIAFSAVVSIRIIDVQTGEIADFSVSLPVADLSWGTEGLIVSMGAGARPSPPVRFGGGDPGF